MAANKQPNAIEPKQPVASRFLRIVLITVISSTVMAIVIAIIVGYPLIFSPNQDGGLSWIIDFAIVGAAFGGVIGIMAAIGHGRLWVRLAALNANMLVMTFVIAILTLKIDFSELGWLLLAIAIGGYVIAAVLGLIMTRPLQQLTEAVQQVGIHNLGERVSVSGWGEIGALAESFNGMATALESAESSRQQLLSDVSHELRTPLTILQNNIRAMLDDVMPPDKAQLATLYSQTHQLNHLVTDLHDLSRANVNQLPLTKIELSLNALIEQAQELFTPLAEEAQVTLHATIPEETISIRADRHRLIQLLQNLLGNAVRHANKRVDLSVWQRGTMAIVEISDDGDGIAPEHLPHIFDRFYRVEKSRSRQFGGSGLGLAISQAVVEAHGGTITAQSEGVSHGTTMRFELPIG